MTQQMKNYFDQGGTYEDLPTETQRSLADDDALKTLEFICKTNNLDFFSLPSNMRMALFDSFIEGVKFVRDEILNK